MELQFKGEKPNYTATFTANGDFNLHLERKEDGSILILQKTKGTEFAPTTNFVDAYRIFDCDFTGYVYPKEIKVVSYSEVTSAEKTENE